VSAQPTAGTRRCNSSGGDRLDSVVLVMQDEATRKPSETLLYAGRCRSECLGGGGVVQRATEDSRIV
jgi:hypothetical protein